MNKVIKIIKDNIPSLLIIGTIIIIALILILKPNENNNNSKDYDLSSLNEITVKEANQLFDNEEASVIIIGRSTCSVCISYLPTLNSVVKNNNAIINYIELEKLQNDSEEIKTFKNHLKFEYTYDNETKTFDKFIGMTPMMIIIKDKKMVYGYLGTMSEKALTSILKSYYVI